MCWPAASAIARCGDQTRSWSASARAWITPLPSRRLERIGDPLSRIRSVEGIEALPVQRPAEIVNYRTMGTTPLVLAGMLAAGAVVALALTLAASARRRSRDLALLKTLGFVRRQVVAVVIWQASVPVAIGTWLASRSESRPAGSCGPGSPASSMSCPSQPSRW
jgi:ABC-type transport system, involved in lipoprotein release, permease component